MDRRWSIGKDTVLDNLSAPSEPRIVTGHEPKPTPLSGTHSPHKKHFYAPNWPALSRPPNGPALVHWSIIVLFQKIDPRFILKHFYAFHWTGAGPLEHHRPDSKGSTRPFETGQCADHFSKDLTHWRGDLVSLPQLHNPTTQRVDFRSTPPH